MRRSTRASIVSNPVLVGAVTVLVVTVAVFLAYNANNGLPFVPTRKLSVVLANGQNLVPQNDVREGGARIGLITAMAPVRLPNGRVGARVTMHLDQSEPAVPIDSIFTVRPRAPLSLKYLELTRGHSARTFVSGDTAPVSQGRNPVELDQLANTYDPSTRRGIQKSLAGASTAFAARGESLNEALADLPRFVTHLEPVARTLAARQTQLPRFIRSLDDLLRTLAPVGGRYARSFGTGATTFDALVKDGAAYEDSIRLAPATLSIGTRSLRVQRPYLRDLAGLSDDLQATARAIRPALQPLTGALDAGILAQKASIPLSERTQDVLLALSDLTANPATLVGLRALTGLVDTLQPTLRYLGPKITVCNSWNFFWTFNADHVSERDTTGTSERTVSLTGDRQDNSVTTQGATAWANGENVQPGGIPQYLHAQPYGHAVDANGNADCEDGQRGYPNGPLAKNLTGDDAARFKHLVLDARNPGNSGPVYDRLVGSKGVGLGRSRVPKGETYTSEVRTGAKLP